MHRNISKKTMELIKIFEGFRPAVYLCSGGYKTIGYGHKLLSGEAINTITPEEASALLIADLALAEKSVVRYINVPLTDYQFDALVSFTFNVGAAALQRSSLRQKINYGLYIEASYEFLKWIYARRRKLTGLVIRRKIEKQLFLGNEILALPP